ncbi:hypothetical protein [Wolbachia endosymbiont (group A) of Scambus nigricans]|uniref:hypothetical protein n=1 Tax=Wolbachia endosymbiont (group A) of Scambus nigricans TaxID=2954055 RepID=UPI002232BE08|nr:hypothetical protein [Wolbachia endosymbiont (group A) of Scambus nigricans]
MSEAITTKQADVVRILLDSGKFNEEEKFNALLCAVTQKYVQGVKLLLGHVNDENMQKALKVAMDKEQTTQVEEITQILLNFITPETSNVEENIVPAPPIVTEANANQPVSSSVNDQPGHSNENEMPVLTIETNTGKTTISDCDNNKNVFTNSQFSMPNEQETIALFTIIRTDRNMLLACYSHKHISYRIRTIIRKAINIKRAKRIFTPH